MRPCVQPGVVIGRGLWYRIGMKISIVVPCYNEVEALPLFIDAVDHVRPALPDARWELLLVDDGSTDGTFALARALSETRGDVRALSFSRNFGKEAAMLAGLVHATGDLIAVMDADLQDPPALLPQMLSILHETGCDCVATRRVTRVGEPKVRSWFAQAFYRLMGALSDIRIVDGARDFRLMTRTMVGAILRLHEKRRFSKGLFAWVGFDVRYIAYENVPRAAGTPKWSFWGLVKYALEGIVWVTAAPLSVAFGFALALLIASLVLAVLGLGIAALFCLAAAAALCGIGVLGRYLTRVYWEAKKRPLYVLKNEPRPAQDGSAMR